MTEMVIALVANGIFKRASSISPSTDSSETGFVAAAVCSIAPVVDENYKARPPTRAIHLCQLRSVGVSDSGLVVILK